MSARISTNKKYKWILTNYDMYILILPAMVYILVFKYWPMYGVIMAFKNFNAHAGIWGSPWNGIGHFKTFLTSFQFWRLLTNTLSLSLLELVFAFPVPIIIALLLNQFFLKKYGRFIQTVLYSPHFISDVVLVGMMLTFLSPSTGIVNNIIKIMGGQAINFFGGQQYFQGLYILSGIWKNMGWNAIIFMAALSGISPDLHEAAVVDGASKLKRILYIDLRCVMPTVVIMLILTTGRIMSVGFEKAFLMQNTVNIAKSEIISTYIYKLGLQMAQYDYATAIGLFNNIINMMMLLLVNRLSHKVSDSSLW